MRKLLIVVFLVAPFLLLLHESAFAAPLKHSDVVRPATGFCYGTGCDGKYYNDGSQACNTDSWVFDEQDDQIYVSGHHLGVLHLYISGNSGSACFSAWSGFRVDNGLCEWNPVGYMGEHNNKDVGGYIQNQGNPVCGNWVSSVMDEDEPVINGIFCESAWIEGDTGWGHFLYKLIWGGSGC